MKTAIHVRAALDAGGSATVDLADLSDAELVAFVEHKKRFEQDGWPWVLALVRRFRALAAAAPDRTVTIEGEPQCPRPTT